MAELKGCQPVSYQVEVFEVDGGKAKSTGQTVTVEGCQHGYVSKTIYTGRNGTVVQEIGIDYGQPGALENHPIPAGT